MHAAIFQFRENLYSLPNFQFIFFQQESNFNITNILFANVWQQDPINTDLKYKEIKARNNRKEVEILKCPIQHVTGYKVTKIFKKEKYKY